MVGKRGCDQGDGLSRRELLARAGAAGAAASLPAAFVRSALAGVSAAGAPALESLTPEEAEILEGLVDRLIPSDASGPGAVEAGVVDYVDTALAGPLLQHRDSYRTNLAALDALARARYLLPFPSLPPALRDGLVTALEADAAAGFAPSPRTFFELVLDHAIQGMFCDPAHGGNRGFAGWDLLGYPGVKIAGVQPAEQALGTTLQPVHRSAYDYPQFRKP